MANGRKTKIGGPPSRIKKGEEWKRPRNSLRGQTELRSKVGQEKVTKKKHIVKEIGCLTSARVGEVSSHVGNRS